MTNLASRFQRISTVLGNTIPKLDNQLGKENGKLNGKCDWGFFRVKAYRGILVLSLPVSTGDYRTFPDYSLCLFLPDSGCGFRVAGAGIWLEKKV